MKDNEEDFSARFVYSSQEINSENNTNINSNDVHSSTLLHSVCSNYNVQSNTILYEVQDIKHLKENITMTDNDEQKMEKDIISENQCNNKTSDHEGRLQIVCINREEICNRDEICNINTCSAGNGTICITGSRSEFNNEKRDMLSVSYNSTFIPKTYDFNGETRHDNLTVHENDNKQIVEKVTEFCNQATDCTDTQSKIEGEMNNNIKSQEIRNSIKSPIENSQELLTNITKIICKDHLTTHENGKKQSSEVFNETSKDSNNTNQSKMDGGIHNNIKLPAKNSQESVPKSMEVTNENHLAAYENRKEQSYEVSDETSKHFNNITNQSEIECEMNNNIKSPVENSHELLPIIMEITNGNHLAAYETIKEQSFEVSDKLRKYFNNSTNQLKIAGEMNNSTKSSVENSQESLPNSMEVTCKDHLSASENSKEQSSEVSDETSKHFINTTDQPELDTGKFSSVVFSHRTLLAEEHIHEEEEIFTTDNDDQVCPVMSENDSHDSGNELLIIENSCKASALKKDTEELDDCMEISECSKSHVNNKMLQNVYDVKVEKTMRVTNNLEDNFNQTQHMDMLDVSDTNNKNRFNENKDYTYPVYKEDVRVTDIVLDLTNNILDKQYYNNEEKEKIILLSQAAKEKYESNFILHERNCSVDDGIHVTNGLSTVKNDLNDSFQTRKIQNLIDSKTVNSNEMKPENLVQTVVAQLNVRNECESSGSDEVRLARVTEQNKSLGCNNSSLHDYENTVTTLSKESICDNSLVTNKQKINGNLSILSKFSDTEKKTMSCLDMCRNTDNKTTLSAMKNSIPELIKENKKETKKFPSSNAMKHDLLTVNTVTGTSTSGFVFPDHKIRYDSWDTLSSSSTESDITGVEPIFSLSNIYNQNNKCIVNSDNDNEQHEKINGTETTFTARETENIVNSARRITQFDSASNEANSCSDDELEIAIKKYENYTKDDSTQTDPLNISYLYENRISLKRKFPCFLVDNEYESEKKHKCVKIMHKSVLCTPDDFDDNDQDIEDTEDMDMDDFENEDSEDVDDREVVCQTELNVRCSVSEQKITVNNNKDNSSAEESEQMVPVTAPASVIIENKLLRKVPIRVGLSRLARPKKPLHNVTQTLPCEG